MFGKLKEKLKSALSVFSRKAEEAAEVKEVVVEKALPKQAVEHKPEGKKPVIEERKAVPTKEKPPEHIPPNELRITYFVHGTTTDNEKGIATGWAQGELSELGRKQCQELKETIKSRHFDAVFCSDLKRAVESARLTFGNNILPDERLRECNYGDMNQKPEHEHRRFEKGNDVVNGGYPHGESLREVEKRMRAFLQSIYPQYQGKHIAIVAHRAPQLALEVLLLGKTWPQALKEDWRQQEPKRWKPGWKFSMTAPLQEIPTAEELIKKTVTEFAEKKEKVVPAREEKVVTSPVDELIAEAKAIPAEEEAEEKKERPEETEIPEKKGFFAKIKEKFAKKDEGEKPELEKIPLPPAEKPPEKPTFFEKVKQTITTKTISAAKFEELFWDLELALLENNVSVEVIERIKEDLKNELVDKPLPRDVERKILETLKRTLLDIVALDSIDVNKKAASKKPYVIAFFGINGAGKTTSIAKLTRYFQQQKLSVVLAAGDTFRAAAIQQLEEHANKLGVKCIKHDYGADAAAVAYDAVKYAEKNKVDVVLIDTAGRLHSNTNLMSELQKIIRVAKPDLKLFVGESITGNDCIEQARKFQELIDLDGVILTKADVDEKGGTPLSIAYTIKKPILFMGVGQKYEDLEVFEGEKIVGRLGL